MKQPEWMPMIKQGLKLFSMVKIHQCNFLFWNIYKKPQSSQKEKMKSSLYKWSEDELQVSNNTVSLL